MVAHRTAQKTWNIQFYMQRPDHIGSVNLWTKVKHMLLRVITVHANRLLVQLKAYGTGG